jgi:hypothetical protein
VLFLRFMHKGNEEKTIGSGKNAGVEFFYQQDL